MAGDWIKMKVGLSEDPAVIGMAADLGIDEDLVVGKLHRVWSWANMQTADGNAPSVTEAFLDRYSNCAGFARAMQKQGWLTISLSGLVFPKFERHNGQTGKQRALTSNRVTRHRNAPSVTKSLPEKRREEKSIYIEECNGESVTEALQDASPVIAHSDLSFDANQVLKHYQKAVKSSHSVSGGLDAIKECLNCGYSVERLCQAADNYGKVCRQTKRTAEHRNAARNFFKIGGEFEQHLPQAEPAWATMSPTEIWDEVCGWTPDQKLAVYAKIGPEKTAQVHEVRKSRGG